MKKKKELSLSKKLSRGALEKLADIGILPSRLGIGGLTEADMNDTSLAYMQAGADIDDDGVILVFDEKGADEDDSQHEHLYQQLKP